MRTNCTLKASFLWLALTLLTSITYGQRPVDNADRMNISSKKKEMHIALSNTQTLSDSLCGIDTAYVSEKTSTTLHLRVLPVSDTVQLRYRSLGDIHADTPMEDTVWTLSSVYDTCCFAIGGLESEMLYVVQVRRWCAAKGAYGDWHQVIDTTRCEGPTHDQMQLIGLNHSSASMMVEADAASFEWVLKKMGSTTARHIQTDANTIEWTNLEPDSDYECMVKMSCGDSWSDYSPKDTFTTKPYEEYSCGAITNDQLYTSNVTTNEVQFNCNMKGVHYSWGMKPSDQTNWTIVNNDKESYVWKNLKPGKTYQYKVKVECQMSSWTDWSNTHYFTTKEDHYGNPCTTPQSHHMSHKDVSYNSASTYCAIDGAQYHWYLSPYGKNQWEDHTSSYSYYHWKNLHYNTKYEYKVKVKCKDGSWTGWSYVGHFTTPDHYDPCTTPTSQHMSHKNVSYNSGSTYCEIKGAQYHWYLAPYGSNQWQDYITTNNYYDWKGLKYNTQYKYKVKVKCHDGSWTGWSYVGHFTTTDHYGDPCTTPQSYHMSYKDLTYNSASTYCAVSGASYHWYLKPSNSNNWTDYNTTTNYYHWTNLSYNTSYDYKVKVKCHDGSWTGWSYVGHFTTPNHYGSACKTPESHHMSYQNVTYNSASTYCSVTGAEYHWYLKPTHSSHWTDYVSTHNYHHWTDLDYNTSYDYRVKVKCHDGSWTGWSYIGHFITPDHYGGTDVCTTPQSHHMSHQNVTYNSASTYCSVSGAEYHWYLKPSGSGSSWTDYSTPHNYHDWTGLQYNTSYDYKVKVKCHDGSWTGWSYIGHFTTPSHYGSQCTTPQSHHMSYQNVTYNSASTYCGVSGAEYHWYLKPSSGNTWTDYTSSNNYYHWNGLKYNTSYDYKVKVKCHDGSWTGWSYVGHFTTHDHYGSSCTTPESHHMSYQNVTYNSASTYCGVTGAEYHWYLKPSNSNSWTDYTSSYNYYHWSNLQYNTSYDYKVKVKCHDGTWTGWSYVGHFTTHDHYNSYCSAPSGGQFSGTLEAYNLYRIYLHLPSIAFTTGIRIKGTYDWWEHTTTVSNMAWGNLSSNTEYEYRVRYKCSNGTLSDWSQIRTFWTGSAGYTGRDAGDETLSINTDLSETTQVKNDDQPVMVFPIPASDQVSVIGALPESEVTIVDMQGQVQMKSVMVSERDQIDVSSLRAGIYHAVIINKQGLLESRKLVIVR
jgi:hypothetical protein